MASCSCCDDPEPGEFRLLTLLVIVTLVTGAVVLLRPVWSGGLSWLRQQDLLVPAEEAALRLSGDVGLSWMTLGICFALALLVAWLVTRVLLALGLTRK